uniref:Membrane bound O-acyl transferase, MBOAT family protein n=1 Tax=Solibacter usitatus (strain Ellin6076) TaxID=234267 RepID=Q01TP2_SOLUE
MVGGYAAFGRASADAAKIWLLVSSFVFFCWSEPRAFPVLTISILFNYWVSGGLAPKLASSGRRLRLALVANIAMLGLFKYAAFAGSNVNAILGTNWSLHSLLLPMGISFFTVQQIMFLVDRHQGIAPRPRFLDYAFFVSWFPYIVAGPITRWKDVIPQFPKNKVCLHEQNLARGTALFIFGLGKKVLLASAFAQVADAGFEETAGLGLMGAWMATASFALQLYFDFSGYTDMARGAALLMNVELPENFDNPLRSLSITEFWQRWHITLTNFITNYIYTPILRAKRPTFRRAMWATVATMTIAGVWHGAGWGFAMMGLWHGIGLAVHKAWVRSKRALPDPAAWCITTAFVLVGFAFFRAHIVTDALTIVRSMFLPQHLGGPALARMVAATDPARLLTMLVGIGLPFYPASASQLAAEASQRPRLAPALAICLFVCLLFMNSQPQEGFIYRRF